MYFNSIITKQHPKKKELGRPPRTVHTTICGGSNPHKITYPVCGLNENPSYVVKLLQYVLYLSRGSTDPLKTQTSKTIKMPVHMQVAHSRHYTFTGKHI